MKRVLSLAMIILIAFQTISFVMPNAGAEADFSRPALPDGPEHTNELVDVINANTTNVLIVTEGYGPLTGVSPITEKDFWVDVLADMTGDFDVDWFDGVPSSGLLSSYDLVIYDAGGYWYPLSGGVTEPLRDYHFSGNPLIVVAPDINYDWRGPVPGFCDDVLHVEGVLGILPEAVYDIYADTGHDIVYRIPKDVGIGIPAVTSWPDCFDPKADCDSVLRQGYIPSTEFGVGTCSGLPQYSSYDPAGTLFSVVAYPGSETEGRAVTYGVPIAGLENTNIAEQLAEDSIRWCLEEKLIDIDLTLYIEDAVKGKDENAAPVVNKAPGDKIDVIATILNKETDTYSIDVVLEVSSDLNLDKAFTRNGFSDIDEKAATAVTDGNKHTVTISLEGGKSRQVVFRFEISEIASTAVCPLVSARTIVKEVVCSSAITMYNMVDNTKAIIVTNRRLLYEKYDDQEVNSLLRYIYKISDWHEENCVVYYVDHYDESLEDWDQDINYDSETTANVVADRVDELVEEWCDKLAQKTYWGPFQTSVRYPYLMIVGSDEVIPFYRVQISGYEEEHYGSDDPVLNTYDHDYFLTDMRYADLDNEDWTTGSINLATGRIVGSSAKDMRFLIENGLSSPASSTITVVGCDDETEALVDSLARLRDEKGLDILNDGQPSTESPVTYGRATGWGASDLVNALKEGCCIFEHTYHGDYSILVCPSGGLESNDEFQNDAELVNSIKGYRPFFVTDSCHTGVVTDADDEDWLPDPTDNLAWILIHDGVSGYLAQLSYGLIHESDNLLAIYFEHLIRDSPQRETNPIAESLRYAVQEYGPSWAFLWTTRDRVAVLEPIIYGVPWMTIDPPESLVTEEEAVGDFQVNVSKPQQIGSNKFRIAIEINVSDYSLSGVNGFDCINIKGAEDIQSDGYPILPKVGASIMLPLSASSIDVSMVDSNSASIGYLDIPCFSGNLGRMPPELVSGVDLLGIYPTSLYQSYISQFDEFKKVSLSSCLAQWNSDTKEAMLYDYIRLELTYETPLTLVVTDFLTEKTEYVAGESINAFVTVSNVGSETLSNLQGWLKLKDCHGQIHASSSSPPFDVEGGETRTVELKLPQGLPHGTYLLEAGLTGSGALATSSTYIKILSGGIVDFSVPSAVKSGDDIAFEVSFMNSKSEDVYGESVTYLYDTHNIEIASLHSSPMTFPANAIAQIKITWSTAGKECGMYSASAMVYAGGESFGPAYCTFEIKPPDEIAPTTSLTIGSPQYVDSLSNLYINSSTILTLDAIDDSGSGSGVALTGYRVDGGWNEDVPPISFHIEGPDGSYLIEYNSTDNAGNIELTINQSVILDNTAPVMTDTNFEGLALQDGVTFEVSAWDLSEVASVTFSIQCVQGDIIPPFESMPATHSPDCTWKLNFDTTLLPDGFYSAAVNATDVLGNWGITPVSFSIRNWACLELLPATESNKAGRTMPVKFSLRIVEAVDPDQPFVYNEELMIRIYERNHPENVLQESTYGDTARDYRIDSEDELYVSNFKTIRKKPKTYVVEIWRKDMLIGSFEFNTVK